jgi:hypothetical protein
MSNDNEKTIPITVLLPGVMQIDEIRRHTREVEDSTNRIVDNQTRRLPSND